MNSGTRKSQWPLILFLLVLALLPYIHQAGAYRHYTNDDAYITLRYARNLAAGRGPFFNAGEHVEGYTNFLHMLQAALIIRCFGAAAAPGVMKVLGLLYGAGCVALSFLLFRTVFSAPERRIPAPLVLMGALVSGAAVGTSPSFVVNCTSGLETAMFAFWLALGLHLGVRELQQKTRCGAGVAFALAVLTRPEGSFLFAAFWLACAGIVAYDLRATSGCQDRLWQRLVHSAQVRIVFANGVLVTAVFLAHLAFRYLVYDGELLPNTYYAKAGGWDVPPWPYVYDGLLVPCLGAAGCAVAVLGLALGIRRVPRAILCVLATALAGAALPFITGTGWMIGHRLVVPYLPAASVCVVAGWALLLARIPRPGTRFVSLLLAATVAPMWLMQRVPRHAFHCQTLVRAKGYRTGHIALANWLRATAAPGDTVALIDAGIIGYTCIEQRILDISGLTDRHIAKAEGSFLRKRYDPAYVLGQEPAFIILIMLGPGPSYAEPAEGTTFKPFSETEEQLAQHPDFEAHYVRKRTPQRDAETHWLDKFAAIIGAEKVFEHGYPGRHYLLVVFRRHTKPA